MFVRNGTQTRNAADLSHSCCQALYIVVQFPVLLYTYTLYAYTFLSDIRLFNGCLSHKVS